MQYTSNPSNKNKANTHTFHATPNLVAIIQKTGFINYESQNRTSYMRDRVCD